MPQTSTPSRRKLIVYLLLALALVGGALRHFAANPSVARDVGSLLLVLWVPVIGNVVAFFMRKIRVGAPVQGFTLSDPFVAHLEAELTRTDVPPAAAAGADARACALVIGNEGFTARLAVPLAHWLASPAPQALPLQFLRPALALPRFPAGTAFQVVAGRSVVGRGRVLATAGPPGDDPA